MLAVWLGPYLFRFAKRGPAAPLNTPEVTPRSGTLAAARAGKFHGERSRSNPNPDPNPNPNPNPNSNPNPNQASSAASSGSCFPPPPPPPTCRAATPRRT